MDESLNVTTSAYLAEDGEPVVSACGVSKVSPRGPGTSVPLTPGQDVESWEIEIDSESGKFAFSIEVTLTNPGVSTYSRWIGRSTGGRVGEANSTGAGVVEMMNNPAIV